MSSLNMYDSKNYASDLIKQSIKNMKYELQQIKSRRTKTLKDRNLTQEERNKIRNKYNDLIKQRIDQLREYREESTIPKELR